MMTTRLPSAEMISASARSSSPSQRRFCCVRYSIAKWMPASSRPGTVQIARRSRRRRSARRRRTSCAQLAQPARSRRRCTPVRKIDALGLEQREPPVEEPLLHLELGNAVAQQPADPIVALEDGHACGRRGSAAAPRPARPVPIRRRPRACRSGAPAAAATIQPSSNARSTIACSIDLIVTGIVVDAEHARRLARRRAQPAGELRKVVRRVQPIDRRRASGSCRRDRSSRESGCRAGSPDGRTECCSPCSARPGCASPARRPAGRPRASRGRAPRRAAPSASRDGSRETR